MGRHSLSVNLWGSFIFFFSFFVFVFFYSLPSCWNQVFYLFHVTEENILLCLHSIGGFTFNEHYFLTLKFLKGNTKAKKSE